MSGSSTLLLERPASPEDRVPGWLAAAAIALAFASLAAWSWGKWTDVHIDFGRELYIAWQLSEGQALYRDIDHRNGPLSHYVNALWFGLFGVSVRTLVLANLAILAGICAMTFAVFARGCGRLTATLVVLVLLGVFAFSQYVGIANYNYVTPYHHFQTHGIALSLAMILALGRCAREASPAWAALAGVCLGALFLTKAELFVPALATAAAGLFLLGISPGPPSRRARAAGVLALAALGTVTAFGAFLAAQMDASTALAGVLGNWRYLGAGLLDDAFYARGAGLDDVGGNAVRLVAATAAIGAFAVAAAAADRWLPGRRVPLAALLAAVLLGALVVRPHWIPWARAARALPLTSLALAVALLCLCWRARREPALLARWAPLALWSVLALALLAKMPLNARIPHYGFALAMPATLLLVAALAHGLPALLSVREGGGTVARGLALAAVIAAVVFFVRWSDRFYRAKDFTVGAGADAITAENPRVSPRPLHLVRAMRRLEEIAPPGASLLVLPEGVSLNYWLRRPNPSRFNLFLPAELAASGAAVMLDDLRANPPDFVALVHRNAAEFGVGPFGVDPRNGREIAAWVRERYRRIERIGAEPFGDQGFGVVLLRRAEAGDSPASTLR